MSSSEPATDGERRPRSGSEGAILIAVVGAGQIIAVLAGQTRPWILGSSLLVLDTLGVVCSWRAGSYSPVGPSPWRMVAAGRAVSLCTLAVFMVDALGGGGGPWKLMGALLRLLMFVLLAAGALVAGLRQVTGRARQALIAETVTVFAAGFMVIWYFALEPIVERGHPSLGWIIAVGWPLGDVLLLAAAASVVLRGAVTRFGAPVTLYTVGLTLYCVTDVIWFSIRWTPAHTEGVPVVSVGIVAASLLMTVAPMLTVARGDQAAGPRTTRPPAWATHLPAAAMLAGCLLLLGVTLSEGKLLPWGVLACGLVAMVGAATMRQLISLRESWDRSVTEPVTGLSNRAGLDTALDRAVRQGEPAALLLLDLDGFNLVNKAYGHAAGDDFLRQVGHRLRSAVRAGTLCARIGGDEFAIVLTDVTRSDHAAAVAERVLAVLAAHPCQIDGDLVPVRASVGVAFAAAGYDGKILLRYADIAMYESKRAGRHGYTSYEPSMTDRRVNDAALEDDMEQALARGELHLLYQPLVDLPTGRPLGAEALLRWQHPTRGPISPVEFIPVAERTGAIIAIGLWVLEDALTRLQSFPQESLYVSVNVAPRQLREPTIVHDVLAVLDRVGVDPHRLVLEVTESALVDETSGIVALRALREHGIRIAIDDFGTGYSSLQYLTRLPVDILKIDRSFVSELDDTAEGAAVAEAIMRLSQVLHLKTVAEGIETEQQAAELRALGCDIGQGYLFAKPLPPAEFALYAADRGAPRALESEG